MELLKEKNNKFTDIDGKELQSGHIVAVRYSYNSYVGVVRSGRLSMHEGHKKNYGYAPYHDIKKQYTYQILGHVDNEHRDFNQNAFDWFTKEQVELKERIRVYDNCNNNKL